MAAGGTSSEGIDILSLRDVTKRFLSGGTVLREQWSTEDGVVYGKFFELQLYRSNVLWSLRDTLDGVICNDNMAENTNKNFAPSATDLASFRKEAKLSKEDATGERFAFRYFTGVGDGCSTCGCLGYEAIVELWHQQVLSAGFNILAITVDFPESWGGLLETVDRMNQANYRRFHGMGEPSVPFARCHWFTALLVLLVLCLCCSCPCLVMYSRRQLWCRRWTDRCDRCCACRRVDHDVEDPSAKDAALGEAAVPSEDLPQGPPTALGAVAMPRELPRRRSSEAESRGGDAMLPPWQRHAVESAAPPQRDAGIAVESDYRVKGAFQGVPLDRE